jgi:serine/threonine protein kinase
MQHDPNSIPLDEITNLELLEKGSFGVIYRGLWRGTVIAIKKLPSGNMAEKLINEFYQEAEIMKYVAPAAAAMLAVLHKCLTLACGLDHCAIQTSCSILDRRMRLRAAKYAFAWSTCLSEACIDCCTMLHTSSVWHASRASASTLHAASITCTTNRHQSFIVI